MNKQTKRLKKVGKSCKAARGNGNTVPTFIDCPQVAQPSKRKTKWGISLPKPDREIVYPAEFTHIRKAKQSA